MRRVFSLRRRKAKYCGLSSAKCHDPRGARRGSPRPLRLGVCLRRVRPGSRKASDGQCRVRSSGAPGPSFVELHLRPGESGSLPPFERPVSSARAGRESRSPPLPFLRPRRTGVGRRGPPLRRGCGGDRRIPESKPPGRIQLWAARSGIPSRRGVRSAPVALHAGLDRLDRGRRAGLHPTCARGVSFCLLGRSIRFRHRANRGRGAMVRRREPMNRGRGSRLAPPRCKAAAGGVPCPAVSPSPAGGGSGGTRFPGRIADRA